MKKIILDFLARRGYMLQRLGHDYWASDEEFLHLYRECIRTSPEKKAHRTYVLYQFAKLARTLDGDVAEVGVYKGESAKLLAELFKDTQKSILLFDTFEGLPGETSKLRPETTFADTSVDEVKKYLDSYPRIEFHQGYFPDSAAPVTNQFSLVHLDADLAETMEAGLEFFYPKMVMGGAIVMDDYRSKYWPKVTEIVDRFAQKVCNHPLYLAGSKAVLIKK